MEGIWRIGVVAGMAVNKKAVKRNFWKRQGREILRAAVMSPFLRGTEPRDVLLIFFHKANELTKKQLKEKIFSAARALAH